MANWKLYTVDALAHRFATNQVGASEGGELAPRLVAVNPASQYTAGPFATLVYFNLGVDTNIAAVGFANHNHSGTITIKEDTTFPGDGLGTTLATVTLVSGEDLVVDINETLQYLTIDFGATALSARLGAISALTTAGMIEVEPKSAPMFGPQSQIPGYAFIETGGGVTLRQTSGAARKVISLSLPSVSTADGETGADIVSLYRSTNGFESGLWLTDYTYGEDTAGQGPGLYCEIQPGSGLDYPTGPVDDQATFGLTVQELGRGPQ